MVDVLRHGCLRWFRHLQSKSAEDWVSACMNMMEVVRQRQEDGVNV